MGTLHNVQWAQLLALPDSPALPLQARVRQAVVQAILDGRLGPGDGLPSSRELAQVLGLSRNTVTSAYQQLVDEAFLEARPRSGVFVAAHSRPRPVAVAEPAPGSGGNAPDWSTRVLRSQLARPTLSKPVRWADYQRVKRRFQRINHGPVAFFCTTVFLHRKQARRQGRRPVGMLLVRRRRIGKQDGEQNAAGSPHPFAHRQGAPWKPRNPAYPMPS